MTKIEDQPKINKFTLICAEDLISELDSIAAKSATGEWQLIPIAHIKQIINEADEYITGENMNYLLKGYREAKAAFERPQGEWIIVKDEKYGDNVKCPFCGKEIAGTDLNFCVKCGADMRGETK